jgi:uncharacterized protein (DUF2267 family)
MPTADGQLTAEEVAAIAALVAAQAQVRTELTRLAVRAATLPLYLFSDWWDSAAIDAYIERVMRVVRPAQLRMARTTDAYLARVLTIMNGRRVEPVGAVDITALRRALTPELIDQIVSALPDDYDYAPSQPAAASQRTTTAAAAGTTRPITPASPSRPARTMTIPPEEAYGRIFDSARYHIVARGYTEEQVRAKSIQRAAAVAQTDVMLADRAQSRQTMRTRGVQRYRRVIRPYAGSGGPVCGLCLVASDRTYFVEDLLPIHANCRCGVVPIGAAADPGFKLNSDDLKAIYKAAGSTGGGKLQGGALKRVRVQIAEHGELGPILVNGEQRRRGPSEVAATKSTDRKTTVKAQLASYEKQLPRLQDRLAAGEKVERAISWQSSKIEALRRELADLE